MNIYKTQVMQWLNQENIKYEDLSGNDIAITYVVDKIGSVRTIINFEAKMDGNSVCMTCWPIGMAFNENNIIKGLGTCNEMNKQYRWVKFFLDNEHYVGAQLDGLLSAEDCGEMFTNYLGNLLKVTEVTYPEFMKALWA